jgi:hypothetical protein
MRLRNFILALAICLFGCSVPVFSQSTFGSIVGTVLDASGAAIPGASIRLTNVDENTSRTVESNASGLFELLNLLPGKYTILATKTGFASVKEDNLTLDARQQRRVDFRLPVATTQQTVEVTSEDAVVNTENATISETLDNEEVQELPSNYRGASTSPLAAIVSVPNVQQDSQGNISLAGGMVSMADYTLDGISTVNVRSNGPNTNMYPSSEMLSEFRVSAINNNAEFASAGDVTVTSKSGGNTLHGSAFEYAANRALDATDYGSSIKQAKVWNTFGGSLSGPLAIPHLYNGHDRTFFFIDYEGNRHVGSQLQSDTVPTDGMRAGTLSAFANPTAIADPNTGATYASEGISQIPINSVSQTFLNDYYPAPNTPTAAGAGYGTYSVQVPLQNSTDGFDVRLDQTLSSKQQIAARWSWKNQPYQTMETILPSETVQQDNRNLLFSHNYIFTSSLLNEFRFGLSNNVTSPRFPILGAQAISTLGLTGMDLTASAKTFGGFPGFNFSSGSSGAFTSLGLGKVGPTHSLTDEFTDNVSWIKGRHTLKAGIDYSRLNYKTVNNFAFSDDFGYFDFLGTFTGDSFADFLTGLPTLNFVATTGPNVNQSSGHFSVYGQDEYNVTDKLTVSYGLRWELLPPFSEANGNIANFNPATGDVVIPDHTITPAQGFLYSLNACSLDSGVTPCTNVVSASKEGFPQRLRYTYWKNFDPRVSAAWRPFGNKTVFRAGMGIYTVQSLGAIAYQLTGIAATNFTAYYNAAATPFPQATYGNPLTPCVESANPNGCAIFDEGMDPHFRDPATAQYSVTVERELSRTWSGRVSYIGMNSYRLPYSVDLNQVHAGTAAYNVNAQPYQNFFQLFTVHNVANQNYQAFETQATHRLSSGLFLQGTYTFAKNLGNAGGDAPSQLVNEVGFVNAPVGYTDRFNARSARGNDATTRRNRLLLTSLYDLPLGTGKTLLSHPSPVVNAIVSGWQLSTITMLQTGPFETPTISPLYSQANLNESNRGVVVRPDRIGSCKVSHPGPGNWFNAAAFESTPVGAGRLGNSGVGVCEGPGTVAISGGLSRGFPIYEHLHGRFEVTFTNLLNHPNFAAPATLFIPSNAAGANPPTQTYSASDNTGAFAQNAPTVQTSENAGNRTGQVSLRFDF